MEELIKFSEENLWQEIWPELTLAMGAVLILLIDLFSSKEKKGGNFCGTFAVFFQVCLLVYHLFDYLLINHTFDRSSFSGHLQLLYRVALQQHEQPHSAGHPKVGFALLFVLCCVRVGVVCCGVVWRSQIVMIK